MTYGRKIVWSVSSEGVESFYKRLNDIGRNIEWKLTQRWMLQRRINHLEMVHNVIIWIEERNLIPHRSIVENEQVVSIILCV